MNRFLAVLSLAFLTAAGGCGQELTAGGQKGEVATVVTDDAQPAGSASPASRNVLIRQSIGQSGNSAVPQGTVEVEGSVVLVRQGGEEVPLSSRGTASVRIAASDADTLAFEERVDVGSYTHARITFRRVDANVTSGLQIGPVQVTGIIRVALSQPLTVDAPISLTVRENGMHQVVIDLNASDWLREAQNGIVSAATFQTKLQVRVR